MKFLYSSELLSRWAARAKRCLLLCALCLGMNLALCIFLCSRVNALNSASLLWITVILSTLAGWAVICLVYFVYLPARAQISHIGGILNEACEVHQGVLHMHKEKNFIPKSIAFCRVSLTDGEETKHFHVNAGLASLLPPDGSQVRVTVARKFITAYEVTA